MHKSPLYVQPTVQNNKQRTPLAIHQLAIIVKVFDDLFESPRICGPPLAMTVSCETFWDLRLNPYVYGT